MNTCQANQKCYMPMWCPGVEKCLLQADEEQANSPLNATACSPSGVEADVCADIAARQQKGIAKYGVTVADNPLPLKEWLQHAYEESLDKAIYLKRAILEMENDKDQATPKEDAANTQPIE